MESDTNYWMLFWRQTCFYELELSSNRIFKPISDFLEIAKTCIQALTVTRETQKVHASSREYGHRIFSSSRLCPVQRGERKSGSKITMALIARFACIGLTIENFLRLVYSL